MPIFSQHLQHMQKLSPSRRRFIRDLGCLTVSLPILPPILPCVGQIPPQSKLPGSLRHTPSLDAWIKILADNRIRIYTGKVELGQGIKTVIRQVAAEELMTELEDIEIVVADTGLTPDEGYTAGSGSVKSSAMAVRCAAATAREYLCQMAAERLSLPVNQIVLHRGFASAQKQDISLPISDLLEGKMWNIEARMTSNPIAKENHRFVGRSISRLDLDEMSQGKVKFIHDLIFPDMIHARILRPPTYSSKLISCDHKRFGDVGSGQTKLHIDGSFVALMGSEEYTVITDLKVLEPLCEWMSTTMSFQNHGLKERIPDLVSDKEIVVQMDGEEAKIRNVRTYEGSFYKPYILHASLGPACGLARYDQGLLTVWSHSQGVYPLRRAISSMLDLPEEQIRVIGVPGAGCFGHNSSDDAAAEAALLALQNPGRHVRVAWSRSEENRWEATGSAMRMDVKVAVDDRGMIRSWTSNVYTDSHSTRPNKDPGTLLAARYLNQPVQMRGRGYLRGGHRNSDPYYQIPNKHIQAHFFEGPLRVSSLRSLGAYANIFAIESLVEEISHSMKEHPIDYRIKHLEDPRAITVLEQLKKVTERVELDEHEGLGYAFSRYKNNDAYCGVACKVSVNALGTIQIQNFWVTIDVGEIMNFDGVIQQAEGAVCQAASWTLAEEVKFANDMITSSNFDRYSILRMRDVQRISVYPISRPHEPALGGGEAATPPTPAAITNAIFAATGKRIYDLPVGRLDMKS